MGSHATLARRGRARRRRGRRRRWAGFAVAGAAMRSAGSLATRGDGEFYFIFFVWCLLAARASEGQGACDGRRHCLCVWVGWYHSRRAVPAPVPMPVPVHTTAILFRASDFALFGFAFFSRHQFSAGGIPVSPTPFPPLRTRGARPRARPTRAPPAPRKPPAGRHLRRRP